MKTIKNTLIKIIVAILSVCTIALLLYVFTDIFTQNTSKQTSSKNHTEQKVEKSRSELEADPEEKPEIFISKEEKAVNARHIERYKLRENSYRKNTGTSSYADGKIVGTWDQIRVLGNKQNSYGFRVDGSIYNQLDDVIYAISYAGHIWKINRLDNDYTKTSWELKNHKYSFSTSYIEGLNTEDGSFRMVRSSWNGMQYSDDEGQNWSMASGTPFTQSTTEGALSKNTSGNRIFVAGYTSSSSMKLFVSENNGLNYSELNTSFNPSTHTIKILKPCASESVFLFALNKSTFKLNIYECGPEDTDFSLIASPSDTFTGLSRVMGTWYQEKYHFYIAGARTHIYYSEDKGSSWQITSSNNEGDGDIYPRTVHPTKPNIIFKGFIDVYMSETKGTSFSNFSHHLGWDVHHMKMYQKTDGSFFHFVGKDFGCYISDTPETASSYMQLNNTSPIQMCYDADHCEHYAYGYSANQDRGTIGYETSTNEAYTKDVKTTDGLRVSIGNNEESVWTWMYYGSIFHTSNFPAENAALAGINWTGKWWASPMIPSPNKYEDAIYVPSGNKLIKFTYNPNKNSIIQTEHYYDAGLETGSTLSGFGYSEINPQRWYISTKNGYFLYSTDGGQTFTKTAYNGAKPTANDQSYNYHKNQHVIKASKINEETVYYAGVGNVFLISHDGGQTFLNHNNGLDVYRIRDFALSEDEKFIFAACANAGIWIYSVDEDQWYEMNDASVPTVNFTNVKYLAKEQTIVFATYGNGILRFKINGQDPELAYPKNLQASTTKDGILLQWEDVSNNENGFVIERTHKGNFIQVDTIAANQISYTDTTTLETKLYSYRVQAINASGNSHYSNYATAKPKEKGIVAKDNWVLVSVDSEETYSVYPGHAYLAFDNNESTFWHTEWHDINPKPTHPHEMVIDMQESQLLYGFSYLTRQDGNPNGTIAGYEFHLSTDNINWTKATSGTWPNTSSSKDVFFNTPIEARYLKFISTSEVNGLVYAACAELSVYNDIPAPKTPTTPQFIQGGMLTSTQIELLWLDLSDDEDGFIVEQLKNGTFTPVLTSTANVTSFKLQNANIDTCYTFRVKAFNANGDSDYSETIVINPNGKTSNKRNFHTEVGTKIYPNPVADILYLDCEIELYSEWEIFDTNGKVLIRGKIQRGQRLIPIDVRELENGIYFLKAKGNGPSFSKTIIKK